MKQNHIELFTAKLKLPDVNVTLSHGKINNEIFDSYKKLLSEVADTLYKFTFKHIIKTLRNNLNLDTIFNYSELNNNEISILVSFLPQKRFDEDTQETLILFKSFLYAAIQVLTIEKEHSHTIYEHNIHNIKLITQTTDDKLLKIYYKHEATIMLANNIEKHLNTLYRLKSKNSINVTVNNQLVTLPVIKMMTSTNITEELMCFEECLLTFVTTIDLGDSSAFEVKFPSSPQIYKLLHVDQYSRKSLQRAARYNDTLAIGVRRITEVKRNIHTKKHELKFIEISENQEVAEQHSLFR